VRQANSLKLTQALRAIQTDFAAFKGRPLAGIDDKTVAVLPGEIKFGESFTDPKLLSEKRAAATELEKAASDEGFKLLRVEHSELESLLTSVSTLIAAASGLWAMDPVSKAKMLAAKQAAQGALATALIPQGGTLDGLLALVRAASPMCKMDEAAGHACPLCKRDLGLPEVELFKQYYDLLAGELEKDISALKSDIAKASEFATTAAEVDRTSWDKHTTLPAAIVTEAKKWSDQVIGSCDVSNVPTAEAKAALESLVAASAIWTAQREAKKNAIESAAEGRDELVKKAAKLRGEIEPLEYAQAVTERLEVLNEAQRVAAYAIYWDSMLPAFTPLLKKVTDKAKEAHEELVVSDFEARLDAEYKALAEKDMAAFGVMLARKGTDAAVTVLPQIGGRSIEGILSEGEQRVHALALFFAELETCPQSVFVFDDPVSSFDYNYIANYCARLREFAVKYPGRQVVALTHNWEFFVQLQTTLNQAGLDQHLSVQILENCSIVADYSDKVDDLRRDIEAVLGAIGEPTKAKKEEIAGKLRRLVEAVVNSHVFNHQRHQFKQKSQPITAFQSFTKVVALLPAEATALRDLYAKLSISEHDDPRTAYVNTDKAMFQTRYDQIVAIETAIKARIP